MSTQPHFNGNRTTIFPPTRNTSPPSHFSRLATKIFSQIGSDSLTSATRKSPGRRGCFVRRKREGEPHLRVTTGWTIECKTVDEWASRVRAPLGGKGGGGVPSKDTPNLVPCSICTHSNDNFRRRFKITVGKNVLSDGSGKVGV